MNIKSKNIEYAGGSNLWNKLFFTWITPWMWKFLGSGISTDDLPHLPKNDDISIWTSRLERAVNNEERLSKLKGKSLRLYKPLIKVFWFQGLFALLSKLFYDLLQTLATLALRSFVASLEPNNSVSIDSDYYIGYRNNYLMGATFIILTLLKILVETHYSYWCGRVSLRIQGALISMTFRRVVHWKTSAISYDESTLGKSARKSIILRHAESRRIQDNEAVASSNVFNLIVVDTLAVEGFLINGIECFVFPFRLIIAYFVLRDSLGAYTTFIGMITLIIFLIISFVCQIVASSYKAPFMAARDKRIDRCHEVLSEVRTLQMMGLQDIANDRVMKCRTIEMKANKIRTTLSLIGNWIGYQMSSVAQLVLFLLAVYKGIQYSQVNNIPLVIPASVGVTTLKVLFSLLGPCRNLSIYSFATIEAIISFNRFQAFIRSRPLDLRHCDSQSVTSQNIESNPCTDMVNNVLFRIDKDKNKSVVNSLDYKHRLGSRFMSEDIDDSPSSRKLLTANEYTHSSEGDLLLTSESISDSNINSKIQNINNKNIVVMKNSSYTWNKDTRKRGNTNRMLNERLNIFRQTNIHHQKGLTTQHEFSEVKNNALINENSFKLKNINMTLSLGETIIVVGLPGSGKTSLMNAILDEIVQESGATYVQPRESRSPIAYASQIPWIPSGSVKNTILFGREWNQKKYDTIMDSCQLKQDFVSWQDGDLRIVDEGGFSLSGGQRARICLARALYSLPEQIFNNQDCISESNELRPNSDYSFKDLMPLSTKYEISTNNISSQESILYLLDDIFISLDPGVGKAIFRKLFGYNGLLRSVSTVLSIDHTNLSFLMSSNKSLKDFEPNILVLDDGSPVFFGSYQSYLNNWRCTPITYNIYQTKSESEKGNFEENNIDDDENLTRQDLIYQKVPITTSTKSETLRKVMEKEGRVTGMVSRRTYFWYFSKLKWTWTIALFILCCSKTMFDKGTDYYMGLYTSKVPPTDVTESIYEGKRFAVIYTLLVVIQLAVSSMVFIGEAICGIKAANDIHNNLLVDILNAPLYFFDSNPVGRVLSRFSTDQLMIDNIPVMKIATVLVGGMNVIFQCIVVITAEPSVVFLFPLIGLGIYYAVARYFSRSSRELQRMCLVLYSPLCGVFSEAMSGGPIIRAYRAQNHYMQQGNEIIDLVQRAKFMQLCSKEWSSLRTQLLTFPLTALSSNFFTSFISLFINSNRNSLSNSINIGDSGIAKSTGAGIIGIALYYSESIASNIGMVITSYVNMEKEMISAERLHQYDEILNLEKIYCNVSPCKIKDNPEINIDNSDNLSKRKGVEIYNLEVRYRRPNSNPTDSIDEIYFPPSINNMNARTGPNEHIGVIGRTGSGKSTFLQAILGLVPITKGKVLLDDMPINQMNFEDRDKLIGVLPQVPLILKGWTVRNFLDPYQKYSKEDLWNALNICGLSGMIRSLPGGKMLDAVIVPDTNAGCESNNDKIIDSMQSAAISDSSEEERYLSDSQLRYLSLARLVLFAKNYRLILVDEPPPDVGQEETADYVPIHQLLRQYFPHCTVFVVAHHAASLQNCNKVWVLGRGKILLETTLSSNFTQDEMLQLFRDAESDFNHLNSGQM